MPAPQTIISGVASHGMPQDGATTTRPRQPAARPLKPIRSSVGRARSGCRPCQAEANDQHSDPAISGTPEAVNDQRCVSCSINGR
jgi:hypothetical protein